MAERAGFEPAVHLLSVRAFSKRLVSATHPPLRGRILRLGIQSAIPATQNQDIAPVLFAILSRMLDFLLGADYQYVSFFSALVAQLDRVLDYESSGQRFESSRVHHFYP